MLSNYIPVAILMVVAFGLAAVFTIAARLVGPSRPSAEKALPYESGMTPEATPQIRFSVQFYRVALLFLVFDIEAAFFYPWAVLFRDLSCTDAVVDGVCQGRVSAYGMLVMLAFLSILLLALAYVWRKRALEWD